MSATKEGGVIDLTLDDDDDNETLPTPPPSSNSAAPTNVVNPGNAATSTRLNKPDESQIGFTGSPPAVRPKPRVSAIPKEKMAAPKPQPAQSRPLDASRRRSDGAAGGDDIRPSSTWLLDDSGSDSEPDKARSSNAPAPTVHSPSRARQPADTQNGPVAGLERSVPEMPMTPPDKSSSPGRDGGDMHDAEPSFDALNDEPMDIAPLYDDDGPVETAHAQLDNPIPSPGMSISKAFQLVGHLSAHLFLPERKVDNAASKKPEETAVPIKRARELRSPPPSEQVKEVQSQAEDANEVDLLLGPAVDSGVTETEKLQGPQQMATPDSATTRASTKPPTLTDKLGMLDLSPTASAPSHGQEQPPISDVEMEDVEKSRPPEASAVVGTAKFVPSRASSPSRRVASEEVKSSETGSAAGTAVVPSPPSGSASGSVPEVTASSPLSPEKNIRVTPPTALHTPKSTPNFKRPFVSKRAPLPPTSPPSRPELSTKTVDDKPAKSGHHETPALPSKAPKEVASYGGTHLKSTALSESTSPQRNGAATSVQLLNRAKQELWKVPRLQIAESRPRHAVQAAWMIRQRTLCHQNLVPSCEFPTFDLLGN